jgi:hypothetical protein
MYSGAVLISGNSGVVVAYDDILPVVFERLRITALIDPNI